MEETIGYEALFSSEEWKSIRFGQWSQLSPTPSLPEADALRMATALNDYELVQVTDIGGTERSGYFIRFRDERFGCEHAISSQFDYWDFIGYLTDCKPWPASPIAEAV